MKTLVIHPDDRSTDFLKLIYENKDWTIVNDCSISRDDLKQLIKEHDRIIMMGHGSSNGLFNPKIYSYIIDASFVGLLKTKETISIWCHSDQFFRRYNIPGFHTGMIISEVGEASCVLGKTPLTKEQTLENMETFARIINQCIDDTPENMRNFILANYIFNDEVTQFNRKNIIVLNENEKIKLYKYIYNKKFFRLEYEITDYDTYVVYRDKKSNPHKISKDNMNKVLNQGDNGYCLYTKEDWNMDVFKFALKDHLSNKIKNLSDQLEKSLNILDEIA